MVFVDDSNKVPEDCGAFTDLTCEDLTSKEPLLLFFGKPEE